MAPIIKILSQVFCFWEWKIRDATYYSMLFYSISAQSIFCSIRDFLVLHKPYCFCIIITILKNQVVQKLVSQRGYYTMISFELKQSGISFISNFFQSSTKHLKMIFFILSSVFTINLMFFGLASAEFKIILMQDNKKAAAKFRPLIQYFSKNGIDVSFVAAKNYPHAASMFSQGLADGMFSGSGVAGCMIIRGLAKPVIRPVSNEGWSTYWAVVLAKKGSPRFTQNTDYFNDKKVIFCSLASSGEFYFHSLKKSSNVSSKTLKASSHGSAIDALSRGVADIAIVKNRVWDNIRNNYPNIMRVGEDPGENPNGTLIVSVKTEQNMVENIAKILLHLKEDNSEIATLIKKTMNISGYTTTNINDFRFTLALLKKAGVTESFDFSF